MRTSNRPLSCGSRLHAQSVARVASGISVEAVTSHSGTIDALTAKLPIEALSPKRRSGHRRRSTRDATCDMGPLSEPNTALIFLMPIVSRRAGGIIPASHRGATSANCLGLPPQCSHHPCITKKDTTR